MKRPFAPSNSAGAKRPPKWRVVLAISTPSTRTIRGLRFYDHAETPGLGDQVDSPSWRAQWDGKLAYGEDGEPRIEVIRGTVQPGPGAEYQVDGLSGATLTARGVTNLLHYWLGPDGFGPYLERLRTGELSDG